MFHLVAYSQLLRCTTARGSCTGLVTVDDDKVKLSYYKLCVLVAILYHNINVLFNLYFNQQLGALHCICCLKYCFLFALFTIFRQLLKQPRLNDIHTIFIGPIMCIVGSILLLNYYFQFSCRIIFPTKINSSEKVKSCYQSY